MSAPEFPVRLLDRRSWKEWAQKHGVKGKSIYELGEYDSASKIGDAQYLALRALWKIRQASEFHPRHWGIHGVEAAREKLRKLEHWKRFIQAVPLEVQLDEILPIHPGLGDFKLIWYYGQLIRRAPSAPDNEENINFTPWSERLRERNTGSDSMDCSQDTPTQMYSYPIDPSHLTEWLNIHGIHEEEQESEARERPSSSHSPFYQSSTAPSIDLDPDTSSDDFGRDPNYEEPKEFPRVSDENMVNAYLIGLASLITFSVEGVEAHWAPERKGYKVCDEDGLKLYEARTDGHMFLTRNRETKGIVEVKPVVRAESPRVMMQETAQMAAWIHADRDVIQEYNQAEQMFRRLLWSMNRHQLYIIIAQYDAGYVDYLTNPNHDADCESFLTMNQFGPWDIGSSSEVEFFAAILLAVTLQFSRGMALI
ncbi:hypothetical protein AbraIFM66950_011011 [Aspergillus brasiliensis]|nr:hypothetical protein AbraIFM66950_011011 [Aspergillus brasiliensis]